jgi:DNA (cytosine-5)-methyltransferase 1
VNGLSLFTGSGIGELAFKLIFGKEYQTIGYVEWDKYCQSILRARIRDGILDDAPIFGDIRQFNERYASLYAGRVDWLSGGFPCQPFSTASHGRRVALDLWPDMLSSIALIQPSRVFCENVSRWAIDRSANDIESLGYTATATPCSAANVGADHIRERYWLLGDADNNGESVCAINDEASWLPELQEGIWSRYPNELRMAHGVAHRVDRLRACGNGWVPQVVARILQVTCAKE